MKFATSFLVASAAASLALAGGCTKKAASTAEQQPGPADAAPAPAPAPKRHDAVARVDFNRWAVRLDQPIYWIVDANKDGNLDPDEVAALLFYPQEGKWVADGAFTPVFETTYDAIAAAAKAGDDKLDERQKLVGQDLDQGRATLVRSDLRALSADEKSFVDHMLAASRAVDALYDLANGNTALAAQVPEGDAASQSLFRRNRGPRCVGPTTEKNPACSAIPGAPRPVVDIYPAELQKDPKFCTALEKRKDATALLGPFTVVREQGTKLVAVPYSEAYKPQVTAVATELRAAKDAIGKDAGEAALVAYLEAAARAFETNDWLPADEAWAKMNAENSKWYVRVAPDETYWEPCAQKAGFHLTFARINKDSLEWQKKLVPVLQEMEKAISAHAGPPYKERQVAFHLPDFVDIVTNAGDDRGPLGATIGQSLPNWGAVAEESRGRTVAMSNLYQDPDSQDARHQQAASMLDADAMAHYADSAQPGLLSTILHEASHNLGPSHDYKAGGKTDTQAFGGQLSSMMEELKAQTGGLFLVDFVRGKGLITDEMAKQVYVDCIVWAFGHISQGMYTAAGDRKAYSQLAAVQIGILIDEGALVWDENATAANGKDKGAYHVVFDKLVPAIDTMMTKVAQVKAKADKKGAEALAARYVDGDVVPQKLIAERFLRFPKASFVFAVER
jgi:hypothetical protein